MTDYLKKTFGRMAGWQNTPCLSLYRVDSVRAVVCLLFVNYCVSY